MYSIYEDSVLDPFWGTGTTSLASMISARNSIGYEINLDFMNIFKKNIENIKKLNIELLRERLNQHLKFVKKYQQQNKEIKYNSIHYKFPVITKQEREVFLYKIKSFREIDNEFFLTYEQFDFKY
jgi:ribosomal protein S2